MIERLLTVGLGTFTLTYFLLEKDGPLDMFVYIRTWALKLRFTSLLFQCHWCLSTWVCIAVLILYYFLPAAVMWLAAVAIANLVYMLVQKYG